VEGPPSEEGSVSHLTDEACLAAKEGEEYSSVVDLGLEMLRIEFQDLLTDEPGRPIPDSAEILRFVYQRDEMTSQERVKFRMRLNASHRLRDAYNTLLRLKAARE
jgi:hypothetical protein